MSTSLVLIVSAIVILITALVVITVFGGGMQNFLSIFNPWGETTAAVAQCQGVCQQLCLTHGETGEPPGWSEAKATYNSELRNCKGQIPGVPPCDCSSFQIGLTCNSYNNNKAGCIGQSGCKWTAGTTPDTGICS